MANCCGKSRCGCSLQISPTLTGAFAITGNGTGASPWTLAASGGNPGDVLVRTTTGVQWQAGGGGGGAGFDFVQPTPVLVWTINHALGYRPVTELRNPSGQVIYGEVQHTTLATLTVTHNTPQAGSARCT
jgi:hypothetical protein